MSGVRLRLSSRTGPARSCSASQSPAKWLGEKGRGECCCQPGAAAARAQRKVAEHHLRRSGHRQGSGRSCRRHLGASSQSCIVGSRRLVQRTVHDRVAEALAARANKIRLGNPLEDSPAQRAVATGRPIFHVSLLPGVFFRQRQTDNGRQTSVDRCRSRTEAITRSRRSAATSTERPVGRLTRVGNLCAWDV